MISSKGMPPEKSKAASPMISPFLQRIQANSEPLEKKTLRTVQRLWIHAEQAFSSQGGVTSLSHFRQGECPEE